MKDFIVHFGGGCFDFLKGSNGRIDPAPSAIQEEEVSVSIDLRDDFIDEDKDKSPTFARETEKRNEYISKSPFIVPSFKSKQRIPDGHQFP